MKMQVEKAVIVPPGKHTGKIVDVKLEERGDPPFPYLDLHVQVTDEGLEDAPVLRAGFAASKLTPVSQLGRLVGRMLGKDLSPDDEIDVEKVLKGTTIVFDSDEEVTANGRFTRIVKDSINPTD